MRGINRFQVLKSITEVEKFSELVFEMVIKTETEEAFVELLEKTLSEEELQTIEFIAQSDYPLSLERKQ